ncbi:hypothetical protein SAMN05216238_1211 [Lentibacillus persicus]|uniref:Uncharacterized protein n=1 Tax=Lentibacillus persicus TaxID=640948 RepID=A0A1I1WYL4_9BACI|nr:hypothetical protein [Lentibacillus persicus]SFE00284.1 hypothetical protein SAMN05216238_10729 [Lentibacillus persicus]SFE50216.1 hypothetical protein SAMN05216238_1211 [Lentibacillus persicus]
MNIQELMPIIIIFLNLIITIAIIFGAVFTVKYVKSRNSSKEKLEERVRKLEEKVNK